MSKEKNNENGSQFEKFVEKAVVPNDNIYTKKGFVESNVLEAQVTFAQGYDAKKFGMFTKGLNWIIAAVVIALILSVVIVSASNRTINLIYTYEDSVAAFEIRVGLWGKANIRDIEYLGPYDTNSPYKYNTGKVARLMKSIDYYDAVLVVCDEEQILELLEAKYVKSIPEVIDDAKEEYYDFFGSYSEGQPYGLATAGSIPIIGTGQELTLDDGDFIAITKEVNRYAMSRTVKRFIKLYFDND